MTPSWKSFIKSVIPYKCEWVMQLIFPFKTIFKNAIEFIMTKISPNSVSLAL